MVNKRLKYLDCAKGSGILCLLFAHTMNVEEHYIGIWITSWFMPIFFIASGIILQEKNGGVIRPSDIIILLKKRAVQLGIPYFFWGLMLTLFYSALSLISGNQPDVMNYLLRMICLRGIDSLWFIPAYFLTELLLHLLLMIKGTAERIIRLIAMAFGVCCILLTLNFPFVLVFDCFVFSYSGYLFAKYKVIERIHILLACVMLAAGIPLAIINGAVGLAALTFNNGFLYVFNGLITSFAVISIFHFIETKKLNIAFLEYFGRNSIVILCTNNLLIELFRLIDSKLTGNVLLSLGIWGSVIFTLILIAIELVIMKLSEGHLGVLFGKKRKRV